MIRKKALRKLISILSVLLVLKLAVLPSYAIEAWPDDCYAASEGACLMDADSKTVLFAKDADTPYYPASITKVLTALLVLENCSDLSEKVTFSYDAVHIEEENSTVIGASEGDVLSVLDCLYCLLFHSANEVANALAEHVGAKHPELKGDGMSDRDVFILMMNEKAAELGCRGSHFSNPSGLNDREHYVTAYDMCLIMAEAVHNETFLDIESHTYWTHAPIARYPDADDPWNTVYPKHSMLKRNNALYYKDAIAGKTGYTITAGNTLVTAALRDGMTLVTCVLNAHSNHYNDTIRLMDFGFDNFTSVRTGDYDDLADVIQSDFSIGDFPLIESYTMGIDPETRVTIPKSGSFTEVEKELAIEQSGESGASSARITYTYGTRTVGSAVMKLMSLGDDSEMLRYASEDPLLASVLGETTDTDAANAGEPESTDGAEGEASEEGKTGESSAAEESAAAKVSAFIKGIPGTLYSAAGKLALPAICLAAAALAAAGIVSARRKKQEKLRAQAERRRRRAAESRNFRDRRQ